MIFRKIWQREHRDKVEATEAQLSFTDEEHKLNLENLRSKLQNSELNQVGILLEKHKTEIVSWSGRSLILTRNFKNSLIIIVRQKVAGSNCRKKIKILT